MKTRDLSAVPAGPPPVLYSVERTKAVKLVELTELFIPHVDAILRPKCRAGIASMMRIILEDSPSIAPLIASLKDGTAPPERIKAFRACGIGFAPLTLDGLKKNAALAIRDAVDNAAMKLALAWLGAFLAPPGDPMVIDTDALDDAMLPPLGWRARHDFAVRCEEAHLAPGEAKDVLRRVRNGLTCDPAFPDAAAEFLDATLVCIRR